MHKVSLDRKLVLSFSVKYNVRTKVQLKPAISQNNIPTCVKKALEFSIFSVCPKLYKSPLMAMSHSEFEGLTWDECSCQSTAETLQSSLTLVEIKVHISVEYDL